MAALGADTQRGHLPTMGAVAKKVEGSLVGGLTGAGFHGRKTKGTQKNGSEILAWVSGNQLLSQWMGVEGLVR